MGINVRQNMPVFLKAQGVQKLNSQSHLKLDIFTQPNELPSLIVPGFNDHNVILFKGNKSKLAFGGVSSFLKEVEDHKVNLYQKVAPAVVRVQNIKTITMYDSSTHSKIKVDAGGYGSGSIIDDKGHVVTNYHVIDGAESIIVGINKNQQVNAKVVGVDKATDIALLKLDMPESALKQLPFIEFGESSDLKPAQTVFSIGNPFDHFRSISQGIISGLDRTLVSPGDRIINGVIQTDTSVHPGNSGGPLINLEGKQIGINAQIHSSDDGRLSFAIPIDVVKRVVEDIKAYGRVKRPYLGIDGGLSINQFSKELCTLLKLKQDDRGVLLQTILPDSPLAKAGFVSSTNFANIKADPHVLIGGAIITAIDGQPMDDMLDIYKVLDEKSVGSIIKIDYISYQIEMDPYTQDLVAIPELKSVSLKIEETPENNKE